MINYDVSGRITSYPDRDRESCSFDYDKEGKIIQIKKTNMNEPAVVFNYIYDNNRRYIFFQKKDEKEKINPRYFTFEEFGNWETVT